MNHYNALSAAPTDGSGSVIAARLDWRPALWENAFNTPSLPSPTLTLDHDAWRAAALDAQSVLDIISRGDVMAFRSLSSERKGLATLLAKANDPELGLAALALDQAQPAMLAEILASPLWALSCGVTEKRLADASRHLASKIVAADALSCLPAAARFDSAIPWLAALRWAEGNNRHDAHIPLSLKHLADLSHKSIGDTPKRGSSPTGKRLQSPVPLAGFQAALSVAASQYLDPMTAVPASRQGQELHDALILAVIARAMASDSGAYGQGSPAAAKAGISAIRALVDAHTERAAHLPAGLLPLMLTWGCSGRGESSAAIDISESIIARQPLAKAPPLALPVVSFDMATHLFGKLPERIDAAWLCAAHARLPEHVESAKILARHARGPIPTTKLQAPSKTHPLSHMQIVWENTVKAGRKLPKAYIHQCLARTEAEAKTFDSQWNRQKAEWLAVAGALTDALVHGKASGDFPPGQLPTVESLCSRHSLPVTPLEWRLANDNRIRQGADLAAAQDAEQCYLASAAIGMDPHLAVHEDPRRLMSGLSSPVRHSLERAELSLLHPDPGTQKRGPRI